MSEKKILVIDDELGMRDLMRFLLQLKGFEVSTACNGMDGLEMVKNSRFDAIFLDIHMPVMNGLETLKLIKKIRPEQDVMLFSSGSDRRYSSEQDAKKVGVCACLYKPFDIDEVYMALEKLFDGREN